MSLFNSVYKPDVLTCLSDLSNDEVMTPPDIANRMLDLLPKEIWHNPSIKILDPACKSGVFLREAAKRFIEGEKDIYPDLQERCDHIFKDQLYGIAITELTSLLSRRSLYCSKYPNGPFSIVHFDDVEGNVHYSITKHTWDSTGKCIFCGATEDKFGEDQRKGLESHAYQFIHTIRPEDIFNMHFDVIISNPPYQVSTGGGIDSTKAAKQAMPIYNKFIEQAKKLNPRYMCMIVPARWYNGGIGLDEFRRNMLNNHHIVKLVDYVNSKDAFQGVNIAGGVCYFLWSRDNTADECTVVNISGDSSNTMKRRLNEYGDIFIRSNESISIINKVKNKATNGFLSDMVSAIDTFGIPSKEHGHSIKKDGDIVLLHSVGSNKQGKDYIARSGVKKNQNLIDKYKVKISMMIPQNGEVGIDPAKGYRSIASPYLLYPGEVDTFSYLNIGFFDTEEEATNYFYYIQCKFVRFMLRVTYSGVHISKNNFIFAPIMDFHHRWTDEELYRYFELSKDEINMIESTMRPMNEKVGDDNA